MLLGGRVRVSLNVNNPCRAVPDLGLLAVVGDPSGLPLRACLVVPRRMRRCVVVEQLGEILCTSSVGCFYGIGISEVRDKIEVRGVSHGSMKVRCLILCFTTFG